MAEAIRVNFGKPMPLFPLPDAVLLPHAVLPLHIFERRYRQMIDDCLDDAGQIAMASFTTAPTAGTAECADVKSPFGTETIGGGAPTRLRPVVCIGQIIQHEALSDGRHNVLLHGVCRAKITEINEPSGERLYPLASVQPTELIDSDPPSMNEVRTELRTLLSRPRLKKMRSVETVIEWFDRSEIPTHALLELIGFTLIKDSNLKYRLLAEANVNRRARLIKRELIGIDHLVSRAEGQSQTSWPKGMSWN